MDMVWVEKCYNINHGHLQDCENRQRNEIGDFWNLYRCKNFWVVSKILCTAMHQCREDEGNCLSGFEEDSTTNPKLTFDSRQK